MNQELSTLREELIHHPMYSRLTHPAALYTYMQYHVFAVWDFMTLLKRLQQELTGVGLPWLPSGHPSFARLINEIVLAEESDEDGRGGYLSHFELYLEAMEEVGADTRTIRRFIDLVGKGADPLEALRQLGVAPAIQEFVATTLHYAMTRPLHQTAAVFFFGREDIIPEMFERIIGRLEGQYGLETGRLRYYLARHIEIDGEQHGPWALQLLDALIGPSVAKRAEAEAAAVTALKARIRLWDAVLEAIKV
ncbi:MAG: DUF3050 domain-containing protein [Sulfobacillus sp.]|nr:DUF3050 domain-containing protein [Sulfobacillus sp.]